ncbi:transposase [Paracoccus sp. 08]|nr:transposase [Paracoccus sp. 08]
MNNDAQIERLKLLFPESHGKPRVDEWRFLNCIIFIDRNELSWCDELLPVLWAAG